MSRRAQRRNSRVRINLFGRHARQTPLGREVYQPLFAKYFEFTDDPLSAQILVLGFCTDVRDNAKFLMQAVRQNPALKLVVMSEEPLWDTVWGGSFWNQKNSFIIDDEALPYVLLNHATSSIYDFESIPYYLTSFCNFFPRYANLFRQNAAFTGRSILEHWATARWRCAFIAERRCEDIFGVRYPDLDIQGLSIYRTEVAEAMSGDRVLRVGYGWPQGIRRHELPDWHLDKLSMLGRKAFVISSLENTHQSNYVSEKLFDAFAAAGVPLYFASPSHRVHQLLPHQSFINVFGLTATLAAAHIERFSPSLEFAEAYLDTQQRLAELFSKPSVLDSERERVVSEVVRAIRCLED